MANIYNICQKLQAIADAITQGGGGGGTTVVANPTGTPSDDLDTIQIGNTIYDIPGSGGGGVGTIIELYAANQFAQTITLAGDLFDYDMIFVEVSDRNGYKRGLSYAVDELAQSNVVGFDNMYGYVWYTITNGTTLTNMANSNFFISSITGVSMGSSGAYTFDTVPTEGSTNPVTSNGIYEAVNNLIKFTDSHIDLAANTLSTGQWTRFVLNWSLGANAKIIGVRASITSGADSIVVIPSSATNTAVNIWVYAKSAQSFATSIYANVSYIA